MILQSFVVPIIKVTDSCNFSCEYCYYAQNKSKSQLMTHEDCKLIIKKCFDYNRINGNMRMRIIFHGGEPLLQPLEFYEDIIKFENELSSGIDGFEFLNSIQTNGFLLDDRWIDFLGENHFDIGISIDGDIKYNKHYGLQGVEACTKKVLENIKKLNEKSIPYGIISVITNDHVSNAKALYDFCVSNHITDLSLNYCFNSQSNDSVDNDGLIPFIKQLFDLYFDGNYNLNIREFNELIAKKQGYCTDTCATCDRKNCGQYISFDSYGNVFFCDTGYDKNTAIGNISSQSLEEILDSMKYLKRLYMCRKVYNDTCKECDVVDLCGGGCHRYDLIESGQYVRNYFCKSQKEICKYISNKIDEVLS